VFGSGGAVNSHQMHNSIERYNYFTDSWTKLDIRMPDLFSHISALYLNTLGNQDEILLVATDKNSAVLSLNGDVTKKTNKIYKFTYDSEHN
jgi:hypothetical protein